MKPQANCLRQHAYDNGNEIKAAEIWQKACNQEDLVSCTRLGVLYEKSYNIGRDFDKARRLYTKACEGGEMRGCNNLGAADERKFEPEKAIVWYDKACENGFGHSCYNMANLGFVRKNGKIVKGDEDAILALYQKACRLNHINTCYQLGAMYNEEARSDGRDAEILRESTDPALRTYAEKLAVSAEKSGRDAEKYYKLACNGKASAACDELGEIYEEGIPGVKKDLNKARYYYEEACRTERVQYYYSCREGHKKIEN